MLCMATIQICISRVRGMPVSKVQRVSVRYVCASDLYIIPDSGCRLSCVGKEELWNEILVSGSIGLVPECDRDDFTVVLFEDMFANFLEGLSQYDVVVRIANLGIQRATKERGY